VAYEDANLTRSDADTVGHLTVFETIIITDDKINKYIAEFEDLLVKWEFKGLILTLLLLILVGIAVPLGFAYVRGRQTEFNMMTIGVYIGLATTFAVFNCLMVSQGWTTLGMYQLVVSAVVLAWVTMNATYGNARYSEDGSGNVSHAYGHIIMSHTVGLAILINGAHLWHLSTVAYTDSEASFELFVRGFVFVVLGAVQVIGCWVWLAPDEGVKTVGSGSMQAKFGLAPSAAGSTQLHERASMLKNSLNLA
jgi:hypothetical protein